MHLSALGQVRASPLCFPPTPSFQMLPPSHQMLSIAGSLSKPTKLVSLVSFPKSQKQQQPHCVCTETLISGGVMEQLGDDELTCICSKLTDENDLKSFSRVSKAFLKVACFRLVRLHIAFVDMLYDILPASPNIESFTCYKPLSNTHLILLSHSCPKLEVLNLNLKPNLFVESDSHINDFDYDFVVDDDGFCAVANACNSLRLVHFRRLTVGDVVVTSLTKSCYKSLEHLDLEGCVNVSDESLKVIGEATLLRYLGLKGCCLITDLGLAYLSKGDLKNCLESLVLAECDRISDTGIISLKEIFRLRALVLKKCGVNITDSGVVALLSENPNIRTLDLSWLINITDISLLFMASKCMKLGFVHLDGCEAITGRGVRTFAPHPRLEYIKLYSCYNLSWEDLEVVASTCIGFEYVGLSRRIKTPMPEPGEDEYERGYHCVWINWK